MKEKVVALIIGLVFLILPMICFASHEITYFRDNKAGAVSITFDDGYKSQLNTAVPALNARDLKGTFFQIISESQLNWDELRIIAEYGHEIGSHTMTHPDLTTLNDSTMLWELSEPKNAINQNVPSQPCVSISYPYGAVNAQVQSAASSYYISGRATWSDEGGFLNHYTAGSDMYGSWQQVNFYDTGSYGFDEPYDPTDSYFNTVLTAAMQRHAWLSVHFHDITDGEGFAWVLDYLLSKDLWINTYGSIVRYMRERLSSTVTVLSEGSTEIKLDVSHPLDPSIYIEPLTLRSTLPPDWLTVKVQQGENAYVVSSITEGLETTPVTRLQSGL